jgi:hypothetical protein
MGRVGWMKLLLPAGCGFLVWLLLSCLVVVVVVFVCFFDVLLHDVSSFVSLTGNQT